MRTLFERIADFDTLLAVQVASRIDYLLGRIEDLESSTCLQHEAIIEQLTIKLAASQAANRAKPPTP